MSCFQCSRTWLRICQAILIWSEKYDLIKTQLKVLIKSWSHQTDKPGTRSARKVTEKSVHLSAQGSSLSPTVLGALCSGSDSRPQEPDRGPLTEV